MNAVGVYIYAGGFSIGIKKHFNIVAHCEDPKPYGLEVIRNNPHYWGNMPVYPAGRWDECKDQVDFVFANPPCAPFSNNNVNSYIKGSWRSDPRIACWRNIVSFAKKKEVKIVALESVPQCYSKAPDLIRETIKSLAEVWPYQYVIFHNISLMGSLQNRNRVFIVGSHVPLKLENHLFKLPTITIKDRLEYYEREANGARHWSLPVGLQYIECVKATVPGGSMRDAFHRITPPESRRLNSNGTIKGRPSFNTKRLHYSERCNTLCGFAHIHPTQDRYVSIKEYQVLADYPYNYEIQEKVGGYGYVSRGVSPIAGEWLGRIVKESLETPKDGVPGFYLFDGIVHGERPKMYTLDIDKELPVIRMARRY